MPGACDKWNTELLRTLMCRKVISRQCLTSRMYRNSLVQHNGYMPRQWVFGLIPREENSDLPNLDPEGRFRRIAEMRHKCRMAAIETEGECENQKEFDLDDQDPCEEITYLEIFVYYWRAGKRCASSTRSVAGTSSGHWF